VTHVKVDDAIRLGGDGPPPLAPVITSQRDLFEGIVSEHEDLISMFDGFLLHPRVFDSGYLYVPTKPSMGEPVPTIKSTTEYDAISEMGPLDYALKVHKERDLVADLEGRLVESREAIGMFAENWEAKGVATYCGVMGIIPMGYLAYYRGFTDLLKDMVRDPGQFLGVSMDIADRYADFLAEYAKGAKVPRAWISFANSMPQTVGEYYFERYVWPPAKAMLKGLVKGGVTPILQFDEPIKDYKFLKELPPKTFIVHISNDTPLRKAIQEMGDFACIAGSLKMPTNDNELEAVRHLILEHKSTRGLILSTEGPSPFLMSRGKIEPLQLLSSLSSPR
jgi:hypothetical protein